MERSDRVATVRASFAWDDVGSWEALARTGSADERGNVIVGEGRTLDSSGSIVYTEGEGAVVLFGATDLIVVQCNGTTMVLPRDRAPDLKDLLTRLNTKAG
jgi:mannose-1-phosphate guanylyltransferase